jgi:hypothetical protein
MEHEGKTHMADTFNVTTAVLAAGFAFEAYNEPSENDARWERGADGIDVAFLSEDFAREVYHGILEVRVCEARDLEEQIEFAQALVSGGQRDPYVIFAMNEEKEEGPKEGAIGLGRAVDRVRSSTIWSKSLADQLLGGGTAKGSAVWPEDDERMYLYVKDPTRAQLALTVFDEEVLAEDVPLGATSLHMTDLINPEGKPEEREWSGWTKLTWRPEETQDNTVLVGSVAGAAMAGPVGAAAGGFIGSLIKKPVQGEVRLELKYTPFSSLPDATMPMVRQKAESTSALSEREGDASAESPWTPVLASGTAPIGGSEGIDWSMLSKRVLASESDDVDGYELCCFLSHRDTSAQVAIWRQRSSRLLVVSFRGTSDVIDVLTDISFLQTPLEQGYEGQKSDDSRMVHSGFFNSAKAVNRRLKELLVDACAGTPGEWQLLVTGHSLGGALATLMAPELVGNVDSSRGYKERPDGSLWGQAQRLFSSAKTALSGGELPQFGTVQFYTFGAPRVGNAEFSAYFEDTVGPAAFRIVNDRDVVPRLPRSSKAGGAVFNYEHAGRTVLIAEKAAEADGFDGFWVEGKSEEADNPLREVSPLSNPFRKGELLGDVGQQARQASGLAQDAWEKLDKAAKAKSRSQLRDALQEASADLSRTTESITSRVKQVSANPMEALSVIGLNTDFVQSELELAESLLAGTAITHHLEPSYYLAMIKALDSALGEDER